MMKNCKGKKTQTKASAKGLRLRFAKLLIAAALITGVWAYMNVPRRPASPVPADGSAYMRRETKPTLSPALFVGQTETAYQVAQEIPDLIDRLYCYCECDKDSGHKSLLSCYTDNHAANCDICQDEALDAANMMKQGKSMAEIRNLIDAKYSRL